MSLQDLKHYKEWKGYTDQMLAKMLGVTEEVIKSFFEGGNNDYIIESDLERILLPASHMMVMEEAVKYGEDDRRCTVEDYYRLPGEERKELIDGSFYDISAPSISHQLISMRLSVQIDNYIRKKKGKCVVLAAPVDVQLDEDEYTMVQPDIIVICQKDKILKNCIMGAPDFIIEILSPSTRKKDAFIKLTKYREAGVKEYWMIDLEGQRVVAYFFEEDDLPVIYGMDSTVPVKIYNGELELEFRGIQDMLN